MKKPFKQHVREQLLKLSDRIDKRCDGAGYITPPKHLSNQYGGGSFSEIGLEFFGKLLNYCDLQRNARVLDVGCGIGRIALPLTAYLNEAGSYDGFDILDGVEYCDRALSTNFKNFRFQKADIHSSFYNPQGRAQPEDYIFPYGNESFDLVLSTSVMTHLKPAAVRNYLSESSRVLDRDGYSFHTMFLLNTESKEMIEQKLDSYGFGYHVEDFLTNDPLHVESAIAINEDRIIQFHRDAGLEIEQIIYGNWCGRTGPYRSHQDIVVAKRAPANERN